MIVNSNHIIEIILFLVIIIKNYIIIKIFDYIIANISIL